MAQLIVTQAPAGRTRAGYASLIELITRQWQRERGELELENFLLAIYFMRLGTLVDRAYDRMCREAYGVSGGDMRVLLALRRGGLPYDEPTATAGSRDGAARPQGHAP